MRVLIFEPNVTGHHAPYLGHLLQALADLDQQAIVVTQQDAPKSPSFELHLSQRIGQAELDASISSLPPGALGRAQALIGHLAAAVGRHRAEHVWIPYADQITEVLGARAAMMRPVRWPEGVETEALFFRGRFAYPEPRWTKLASRALARRLIPRAGWSILHMLDPLAYEALMRSSPSIADRLRLMPDPVEPVEQVSKTDARERLGIPSEGRYLGCFGVLARRKGLEYVLPAFRGARLAETDRLLLAGPMDDAIRSLVERDCSDLMRKGRVVTVDRYLGIDELMQAVMAVDVVSTPHPFQIGSASFVIRAAAAGRPLLASDFGWMGWAVPRFELGSTTHVRDVDAFAAAIGVSLDAADAFLPSEKAAKFIRYHSPANFQASWTARLRERLGLPSDERLMPWSSVFAATGE